MFNNRKAKRFNTRKYRENIVSESLYKSWKEKSEYDITFSEFKKYWKLIADEYVDTIINNPDGIRLGASVGDIYVGYIVGAKKRPIDYVTSSLLNKKIYHDNFDSSGKLAKIIYATNKRPYIYKMHRYWAFAACRNFKTLVKNGLRNHPERYKNSIEMKDTEYFKKRNR